MTTARAGRPKASSRETLAEAACELFLEKGYEATSIAEIAARAGVSRSSFFNYVDSKGALLWGGLDERLDALERRLAAADGDGDGTAAVREGIGELGQGFAPDALALAFANAEAMEIEAELERETALRQARVGRLAAARLRRGGVGPLEAEVRGAAFGGAVMASIRAWSASGPGLRPLDEVLASALDLVP
ncbi:TetR/AcrR family transcriptional regulator [Microbacterium marinilacus]|uniref:HTH tetR-type domain-containing protein n=1 Tax=Microbacterium marinilacus TaxID=415209 RepID=A0ABP7B3P9_9MICO|nr:TetR/AcrR family transcriptional regulator [Microbacterium marinilacus]MBY0687938.1 TetR/AcrR family transcriptional regulator [Microbacterium marinilacus]